MPCVCHVQPSQQQGASFQTQACGPGDSGVASDRDKPLAVCDTWRGSAAIHGEVGDGPHSAWLLAAVTGCWLRARTRQPVPVPSRVRVMSQKGGAEPVTVTNTTTGRCEASWPGAEGKA